MKGQINGTMMWIAGLAIAGMISFFNLKGEVAVNERTEQLHYTELKEQVENMNGKLDKISEKLGIGVAKEVKK